MSTTILHPPTLRVRVLAPLWTCLLIILLAYLGLAAAIAESENRRNYSEDNDFYYNDDTEK